jgi:type III restriction enzyme
LPQQEATSQYRIANKIYAQMMQHFYCENGFLQEEVVGTRELEQATQRILKLDEGIQRLYEDNIKGKSVTSVLPK